MTRGAAWRLAIERPDQPEVRALIDALDAYQAPLYPPESNHLLDMAALLRPEVVFVVARDAAGAARGCGAVVVHGDWGEIKRMFVLPSARGGGLAAAVLARLEHEAAARGCGELRLETGIHQHAALAFYARRGYGPCGPFADYCADPLSVFMHKVLDA